MTRIEFLGYYFKLLLGVLLGTYETSHPLDIRWRWKFWLQETVEDNAFVLVLELSQVEWFGK